MRRLSFAVLLAFAASVPMEDSVYVAGVGRVSKVLGLLALVTWLLKVASTGVLRKPRAAHLWASAFVGWAYLSMLWSSAPDRSVVKATTLLQLLGVLWLVWDQAATATRARAVMRAFVLGSLAAAVVTIEAGLTGAAVKGDRFASVNAGPNNTGCLLVIAVVLAWYLLSTDGNRRWAWCYRLVIPAGSVAVLLTASRTATISLGLGLAVLVATRRNLLPRRLLRVVLVAAALGALAIVVVPEGSVERLATTADELETGTWNGRLNYWRAASELFSTHPLVGVGSDAFRVENVQAGGRDAVAHNAFVSIAVELGLVGLALFLLTLGSVGRDVVRAAGPGRRAWVAAFVCWTVGAMSLTWEVRKITWLLLAMALVCARPRPVSTLPPRSLETSRR